METRFAGRTALVTGASRGIGLGIAQRLVADGAKVVITARDPETLAEAVAGLGGPDHALGVPGRADDESHQREAVKAAIDTFGSLDLLVNNAGINPVYGPMVDLDLGAARKTVEVNCLAALGWVQAAYGAWLKQHGGAVLNVSSVSGLHPASNIGLYGATKAMLISMTGLLARELAPTIRVNAVAPAVVKTKFAAGLYAGKEKAAAARYPLDRLGMPQDISGAASFLLSDEASWITGQAVVLDGGLTLTALDEA